MHAGVGAHRVVAVLGPQGWHGRLPLHQLPASFRGQHSHQRALAAAWRPCARCMPTTASEPCMTIDCLAPSAAGRNAGPCARASSCSGPGAFEPLMEGWTGGAGHACQEQQARRARRLIWRRILQRKPAAHLLHLLLVHHQVSGGPGRMRCHPARLPRRCRRAIELLGPNLDQTCSHLCPIQIML